MKASAVRFLAANTVDYGTIEVPEPGPEDVVVDVRYSWISPGTEGSFLRGERIAGDTPYRPGDPSPFPRVPGYQKTGVVTWVGSEVADIVKGDWVFASVSRVSYGVTGFGGHVSPAVTPRQQIWKLSTDLNAIDASGMVLTQVGYNCGTIAPIRVGEWAVVLGDGLVGHWSVQTLAWRGARVLMLGHHDARLSKLAAPGCEGVNTQREEPVEAIQRIAGNGVSVLVDTVGDVSLVEALLPMLRHGGHVVSAGFCGTEGAIDIQKLRLGEISLHCPSGWTQQRMDDTLQLLAAGWLDAGSLVTHRYPAERAAEAWQQIVSNREETLGVILTWT
ncbi:MAG: zinc-binding dehydrogenase [Anaerolineae bacterium]